MLCSISCFAQPWKAIKGNGNFKTETRQVATFSSLSSQGSIDVQVNFGTPGSITVQADENLLPYIETTVENGTLKIKSKDHVNLKSSAKIRVAVSMEKINDLRLGGSGNIDGSGNFTSDGKTAISVSGSGNIHLNGGSYGDMRLRVSGSGNISIKKATANNLDTEISGSGNINCSGLSSQNVTASISGSGNAHVNAEKSVDAKISGSGNVFYSGKPASVTSKTAGSGKLLKG